MVEPGINRDGETGRAMIAGTDVAVSDVLAELAVGATPAEIVARFPGLTLDGVGEALRFAALSVDREVPYAPPPASDYVLRERPVHAQAWRQTPDTVTLDADEYDELLYRIDMLEGLVGGLSDVVQGRTIPHEQVAAELLARYGA